MTAVRATAVAVAEIEISDAQKAVRKTICLNKRGKPYNDRLRELHRMISQFNYGPKELDLMRQEIHEANPGWWNRKLAKEAEDTRA